MQHVFEQSPDAEVTQVALWTAYRTEFEPYDSKPHPMLAAADVIKYTTEAFPQALPMVISGEERRFIIKNMKIRERIGSLSDLYASGPMLMMPTATRCVGGFPL
jgi:chromatin structure-remodeling complex subunit RSC9